MRQMYRSKMQHRDLRFIDFTTRNDEENNLLIIEGYFAVFNSVYQICDDCSESFAPGAFTDTINDDIRALFNHNVDIVLGRTKVGTLKLKEDDKGLFAQIIINAKDSDAVNAYERIKRGDVDQCSIGFEIIDEEYIQKDNKHHWIIKKVKLYEVSPCVFPAYEETTVSARKRDLNDIEKRKTQAWKKQILTKLKGGQN